MSDERRVPKTSFSHRPVLLTEVIEELHIKPDGIYVDGTLGGAGHSIEITKRLSAGGRLIGIDQDADAINAATERLAPYRDRVTIVRENYRAFDAVLNERNIKKVDGILLDLGVSSFQLDTASRGFTYREADAPLDMRMDQRKALTAKEIVNTYSEGELYRILRDYGEERFAKQIARNIVAMRDGQPVTTAGELVEIIRCSIPKKQQMSGGHPAKRTFQAIRIELNEELTVLSESIDRMIDRLNDGGRLAIITFHSLEDRIVKNAFRRNESPCTCPPNFPVCVCGNVSKGEIDPKKPILPSKSEQEENQRSKSAKLRVFTRKGI